MLNEEFHVDDSVVYSPDVQVFNTEKAELDESLPLLLIVDDNEEIRFFIKSLLKRQYRTLEAENGAEGVQLALEVIPDLVISDVDAN